MRVYDDGCLCGVDEGCCKFAGLIDAELEGIRRSGLHRGIGDSGNVEAYCAG